MPTFKIVHLENVVRDDVGICTDNGEEGEVLGMFVAPDAAHARARGEEIVRMLGVALDGYADLFAEVAWKLRNDGTHIAVVPMVVTDTQIKALEINASRAGDYTTVILCLRALGLSTQDVPASVRDVESINHIDTPELAREACAETIAEASWVNA